LVGKVIPGRRSWLSRWTFHFDEKKLTQIDEQVARKHYHHNVVAVSPNNKFVATGTSENTVGLFELESLYPLHEFKTIHTFFVTQVGFTQDCRFVISASADYSVKSHMIHPYEKARPLAKFLYRKTKSLMFIFSLIILMVAGFFGTR
jgi:WD40 repeat protein